MQLLTQLAGLHISRVQSTGRIGGKFKLLVAILCPLLLGITAMLPASSSEGRNFTARSHGTLLIVARCRAGIVVASDSGSFTDELGQSQVGAHKFFKAGDYAVVGFTGTTSLLIVGERRNGQLVVLHQEDLLGPFNKWLRRTDTSSLTLADIHQSVVHVIEEAARRFYRRAWKVRPNMDKSLLMTVITTGLEDGIALLHIADLYRPIGSPEAVTKKEATIQFGEFSFIRFGIPNACKELTEGDHPALQEARRIPIVRLYRKRKTVGELNVFTLSETVKLTRVCLEVTERYGKLIHAEASQVVPPNRIATITPRDGFRWVLNPK